MLIAFVAILMVLGGTLCGIEEEAVAFYPVLVPIFIALDMTPSFLWEPSF